MNLVIYDGVCMLCNRFILFAAKADKKNKLMFCELQSEQGKQFLQKYNLPLSDFETIYFLSNEKLYKKSTAILKILQSIGGFWSLSILFYLVPKILRDKIYDIVAENRYKIFSQKNDCEIPNQIILKKIIGSKQ